MTSSLFTGATVFTGRGEDDLASAFRVEDGVVTWVGDARDVAGEPATDLGGRTVLPGLLDVHSHPAMLAALAGAVPCLPPEVGSLAALLDRLRASPAAGGDGWIEGYGFDEAGWPEGRKPSRHDLDRVSAAQPVVVRRCDGHSAVCNTRALELAGITAATPDPAGGRFGRDATGVPDGLLVEPAAVDRVLGLRPPPDADALAGALAGLDRHFLERGIVAVGDLWATAVPDPLRTFREAGRRGLSVQCALYPAWTELCRDAPDGRPADLADGDRTGRVRIGGVKLFVDGAFSDRTAWTEQPWPGSCDHGIRTATDEELLAALAWARRNRVQVAVHAMGDRALRAVVELLAAEQPWLDPLPSVRLEHATLLGPRLLDRLDAARMRFGVVSHSIFLYAESRSYVRNLPPDRLAEAYPIRSFYERVPAAALSSDNPATAWADADDVLLSVQAAVTRRAHDGTDFGRDQAVTVAQALLLYTGRARAVAPFEGVGVLEPGAEASFVVLDRDVLTVPEDEIARVRVDETWLRGQRAYQRCR